MATTLTATYSASLGLALFEGPQPVEPTGFDFTDIVIDTGATIATHTSGVFHEAKVVDGEKVLAFTLADTGTGKTWEHYVRPANFASFYITCTAE